MAAEILIEIGTEEIPSSYLAPGLKDLGDLFKTCLAENRIRMEGEINTYGTPRRLILMAKGVSEQQDDLVQEVTGPPKKVAFDKNGTPTKAATGFAERQGVRVEDLDSKETPKGEYLYVKNRISGKPTKEILAQELPGLIARIPWPKSMRWGSVDVPFVRPVHWILAIMNAEVVPFAFAGIQSGNLTRGHRFMKPESVKIAGIQEYVRAMDAHFVVMDQRKRKAMVSREVENAAHALGGVPAHDSELLETVANLVEYPSAVCGGFDPKFLELPEPVLITVMKAHQKYFAVYDGGAHLMPNFVAINNTQTVDDTVVAKGHERVLRARLSDADFFYKEDQKRPLMERLEDLKDVIYQADLGTSHAKIERFSRLAESLAAEVAPDMLDQVKTAAMLCKCDLTTHMVAEFPELQGVMGEIYAKIEKYPDAVCQALSDHYLPNRADGPLPNTLVGAVVSFADRLDTIAGCFAVGLTPTGNSDPFALRRHALAIIRILENMQWPIFLDEYIQKGLDLLCETISFDKESVFSVIRDFFKERYRYMLLRSHYAAEPVQAVISVSFDKICGLRARIEQLTRFSQKAAEFPALAAMFKRITNILKNQKEMYPVSPNLFVESCESDLWRVCQDIQANVVSLMEKESYYEALNQMVQLRKPVDDFFDSVEVLTKKDDQLRKNRVGLLQHLSRLFLGVADFSKFSV